MANGAGPEKARSFIWNFCFGLFFGGCITYVVVKYSGRDGISTAFRAEQSDGQVVNPEINVLQPDGHVIVDESNRVLESELKRFEEHHHHNFVGQDALAKILSEKVRVLCWVMTGPQNIDKKAVHIYATWGKRCNKVIFISSEPSDKVPVVQVDTQEGRQYLWQKTRAAFQHIYDNLLDDYDWFLKADDDTFVIVENLRYFLSSYKPDTAIYFGHKFKPYVKQGYMSGGGGYVVSRTGIKQLVDIAFKDSKKCKSKEFVGGAEDVEIGKCFENAGVVAGDSRDEQHRNRFHPFQPEAHLSPDGLPTNFWYWSYIFYPKNEGFQGCCADYSVTFHYIPPAALYNLEYLVYHLRPFGAGMYPCPTDLPKEILEEALAQQGPKVEDNSPAGQSVEQQQQNSKDQHKLEQQQVDQSAQQQQQQQQVAQQDQQAVEAEQPKAADSADGGGKNPEENGQKAHENVPEKVKAAEGNEAMGPVR